MLHTISVLQIGRNLDECWQVQAQQANDRVVLQLQDSQMEPQLFCHLGDYAEIRDGTRSYNRPKYKL